MPMINTGWVTCDLMLVPDTGWDSQFRFYKIKGESMIVGLLILNAAVDAVETHLGHLTETAIRDTKQ